MFSLYTAITQQAQRCTISYASIPICNDNPPQLLNNSSANIYDRETDTEDHWYVQATQVILNKNFNLFNLCSRLGRAFGTIDFPCFFHSSFKIFDKQINQFQHYSLILKWICSIYLIKEQSALQIWKLCVVQGRF